MAHRPLSSEFRPSWFAGESGFLSSIVAWAGLAGLLTTYIAFTAPPEYHTDLTLLSPSGSQVGFMALAPSPETSTDSNRLGRGGTEDDRGQLADPLSIPGPAGGMNAHRTLERGPTQDAVRDLDDFKEDGGHTPICILKSVEPLDKVIEGVEADVRDGSPDLHSLHKDRDANIVGTLRRYRSQIRRCYQREVESSPDLEGSIHLELTIGTGKVLNARVVDPIGTASFADCIEERARRWRLDPSVEGKLRWPLHLSRTVRWAAADE